MDKDKEYVLPGDIEKRSFDIIEGELRERGVVLPGHIAPIVKRVIHTTADFDYADTLCFSEGAVQKAVSLLKTGTTVITDTNMALAGINKQALSDLGGKAVCFMSDKDVVQEAVRRGQTRAYISMEKAAALGDDRIFAIGNAPTALFSIMEMHERGLINPGIVIGVPVGFVNVEAAKELLIKSGMDYIVNRGRKGGSTVAAAIVNALMYLNGAKK